MLKDSYSQGFGVKQDPMKIENWLETEENLIEEELKSKDQQTDTEEIPTQHEIEEQEPLRQSTQNQNQYLPKINFEELEHLFMDGWIPDEFFDAKDPMQFNYLLVKFKKEFNDRTHSEFMNYMKL